MSPFPNGYEYCEVFDTDLFLILLYYYLYFFFSLDTLILLICQVIFFFFDTLQNLVSWLILVFMVFKQIIYWKREKFKDQKCVLTFC